VQVEQGAKATADHQERSPVSINRQSRRAESREECQRLAPTTLPRVGRLQEQERRGQERPISKAFFDAEAKQTTSMAADAIRKKLNDRKSTPKSVGPDEAAIICSRTGWNWNPKPGKSSRVFSSRANSSGVIGEGPETYPLFRHPCHPTS
jgi:hypothetical protein